MVPNPLVTYVERLKITFYCSFEFENFPFDSHHCGLNFGLSNSDINSFKLMPTNLTYENFSTLSTSEEAGMNIKSENNPMPFDVTLMSVKPYYEKEYGYLFSFSGIIMKLCRRDLGLLIGGRVIYP